MPSDAGTRARPRFFNGPREFRAWLDRHHAASAELWVGYYKKGSGRGGVVYREALDQALCYGWIDGQVRSIDEHAYMQRFTPRTAKSYWSAVNVRKATALIEAGLMTPAGRAAFEGRSATPPHRYSNENTAARPDASMLKEFKRHKRAWTWFERQAPSFRRVAAHWVTSAKKAETRTSRLATLIDCSARGRRPGPFVLARTGARNSKARR